MKTAYNLLWLRDSESPKNGLLLETYINNIKKIARNNPQADVLLWIDETDVLNNADYRKVVDKMFAGFAHPGDPAEEPLTNIQRRNLRDVGEFNAIDGLSIKGTYDPTDVPHHPFWKKIDIVKFLVCQQSFKERYDEVFFSDMDITNLKTGDPHIHERLQKHGLLVGRDTKLSIPAIRFENQLFGFTGENGSGYLEKMYEHARNGLERFDGNNGYESLEAIISGLAIPPSEIVFEPSYEIPHGVQAAKSRQNTGAERAN